MKYGFIGYGKMGSTIVRAVLNNPIVQPNQIVVYNRTPSKLEELSRRFSALTIRSSPAKVVEESDIIFVCTLNSAVPGLLKEIAGSFRPNAHLVFISGALDFSYIEKQFQGAVTKTIPSITLESGKGVTLICHNSKVTPSQKVAFQRLLGHSSKLKEVDDQQLDDSADFTSTLPAFIAEMMDKWAELGIGNSGLSKEEALELVLETLSGTTVLLSDKGFSPQAVMDRVATKGGNTEQGLKVLEKELPPLYREVFEATRKKRAESKKTLAQTPAKTSK